MRDLDIDPRDKVNVNGGAIALGHPLGATGAMLIGTAARRARAPRQDDRPGHAVHRRRHGHRDDHRKDLRNVGSEQTSPDSRVASRRRAARIHKARGRPPPKNRDRDRRSNDRLRADRRAGAHHRHRPPVRARTRCARARATATKSGKLPDRGARARARARARRQRAARVRARRRRRALARVTGALIAEELAWGDLSIALAILSPGLLGVPGRGLRQRTRRRRRCCRRCTGPRFVPGLARAASSRASTSTPFRPQTTARRDGDELRARRRQVPRAVARRRPARARGRERGRRARRRSWCRATRTGLARDARARTWASARCPTVELALEGVRVPADGAARRRRAARTCARCPARPRRARGDGGRRRARRLRGRARLRQSSVSLRRADRDQAGDRVQARRHGDRDRRRAAARLGGRLERSTAASDATRESALAQRPGRSGSRSTSADGAVQVFGGHGYIREYLPEMHLRNAPRLRRRFEALAPASRGRTPCRSRFEPTENSLRRAQAHYRQIALEQMRPISRRYDVARARRCRASGSTTAGSEGRKGAPGKLARRPNDGFVQVCVQAEELCWGDAGLYLRMPTPAARRLGGRAPPARRSRRRTSCAGSASSRASPSGARWRSPSRRPAPTPPRSRPPPRFDAATDEWVLNGTKIFCTAGEGALDRSTAASSSSGRRSTRAPAAAASSPSSSRRGTPGMKLVGCEKKLGIRASDTATLVLRELPRPEGQPARPRRGEEAGPTTKTGRQGLQGRDGDLRREPPDRRGDGGRRRPRGARLPDRGARAPGRHDPLRRAAARSRRRSSAT